jgi:hypothetical protein
VSLIRSWWSYTARPIYSHATFVRQPLLCVLFVSCAATFATYPSVVKVSREFGCCLIGSGCSLQKCAKIRVWQSGILKIYSRIKLSALRGERGLGGARLTRGKEEGRGRKDKGRGLYCLPTSGLWLRLWLYVLSI